MPAFVRVALRAGHPFAAGRQIELPRRVDLALLCPRYMAEGPQNVSVVTGLPRVELLLRDCRQAKVFVLLQ